jgi:hypothetical protein
VHLGICYDYRFPEQDLYDSTAAWRGRAMAGVLHSGTLVSDPRSEDRTSLSADDPLTWSRTRPGDEKLMPWRIRTAR